MTTEVQSPTVAARIEPLHYHKRHAKSLPHPRNLRDVIEGLRQIFEDDHVDVDEVKEYLGSYEAKADDWKEWAVFDTHRYTRNLIDEGNGKYNLLLVCWGEGHGSAIHDHSDSHCFMKIVDGSLLESKYSWPSKKSRRPMNCTDVSSYEKDQVAYINDSIGLHRVENKSHTNKAVSLHLYSPPYAMCQSFDERSGHKRKCCVTFHTKYGEKVCHGKP